MPKPKAGMTNIVIPAKAEIQACSSGSWKPECEMQVWIPAFARDDEEKDGMAKKEVGRRLFLVISTKVGI